MCQGLLFVLYVYIYYFEGKDVVLLTNHHTTSASFLSSNTGGTRGATI